MFKVRCYQDIYDHYDILQHRRKKTLWKDVELPFPPFPGLILDYGEGFEGYEIKEVIYNLHDRRIECETESWKPLPYEDQWDQKKFDEEVSSFLEKGWLEEEDDDS